MMENYFVFCYGLQIITLISGILRDKTLDDKLIYSPNEDIKIYPSVNKILFVNHKFHLTDQY